MMKYASVKLEELLADPETEIIIKETLDDRLIYREGLTILSESQLFKLIEGDIVVGFFSVDDNGDSEEIHVYIYPEFRRYSLKAFRYIKSLQSKTITTTVYGTHSHVSKFLTRIGFKVTGVKINALVKNGETYHVWELICFKENSNG